MRIDMLREKIKDIENMLVTNPLNINYLTGFTGEGFVIISKNQVILVTDSRYTEQAKYETNGIQILNISDINLQELYSKFPILGFEENHMTYSMYKKINTKLVETQNVIEKLRAIKDEEEIDKIKKVEALGDKCFEYICGYIKPGMSEKHIASEIEIFMKKSGASGVAFDTIVASGENSSMPHAVATERVIQDGDIILLDFGAKLNGYCGDMSRTIFVGYIKEEYKKIYDIVLKAQTNAINNIQIGMMGKEADAIARNIIKEYGYDFGHSLGHGIGLEAHELPRLSPSYEQFLEENMIFSVEPGIYIEGQFGVRIEDLVLLDKNGAKSLSNSNKNFVII
jgi:Xaa-Pro aminopeptidase